MEKIEWEKWFYYDETSPSCLRWRVDRYSGRYHNQIHVKAGDVAGSAGSSNYYSVKLNNKLFLCHRIIIEMTQDIKLNRSDFVDHINRDRQDNRLLNLRVVSYSKNQRNFPKRADNTSGVVGVRFESFGKRCYWRAFWTELDGKYRTKSFNINKLGVMVAFRDAVMYREKMIKELNEQGAGYSERHGK